MSRPLRVEYEDAWYHVMNRGANRKSIFGTDELRYIFLSLIEEIVKLFSVEIHAYCLMGNHYHLLVRTPYSNLGRAMRYLNGVYTQRYNCYNKTDGALFRGRYKAIIIENNNYLLQVNRYIHLNPIQAKLCKDPDRYFWSSYQHYVLKENVNKWLKTNYFIDEMGGRDKYIEYILEGIDEETK